MSLDSANPSSLVTARGGVNDMVHCQATSRPTALAVAAPDGDLTYGELVRRAGNLAARLRAAGIGVDVPVGICLPPSAALVVGVLGVLDAGGAYVAMDPSHPEQRLRYMLADSGARVLVTTRSSTLRPDGVTVLHIEDTGDHAEPVAAVDAGDRALGYVIYTSGSSGRPKGVLVERGGLRDLVKWHHRTFGVTRDDRATQLASPGFDASVWEMWSYLTAGASLHVPDDEIRTDPVTLRDWLLARKITIGFLATPVAESQMLLDWPSTAPLRAILTGGDTLYRSPQPSLPFEVVNNYGLTEATVVSTSGVVPPGSAGRPSIGKAAVGADLHVVDAALMPVPDGAEGELLVGCSGLARGYAGDAAQTAWRFIPDHLGGRWGGRLLRTGDLVRRRADGAIEFLGRQDNQVNANGFRVEPDEIAAVLANHAAVRACVVRAWGSGGGGQRLIAYVVPADERPAQRDLDDFLAGSLPSYMVPSGYVWLEELPLTTNGKVNRSVLPPPNSRPATEGGREPSTETETVLASMVASVLRMDRVSIEDNFFHLGGHSLLGAQLIMRVWDRFGVELSLRQLFQFPTVAGMAAEVDRLVGEQDLAMTFEEGR